MITIVGKEDVGDTLVVGDTYLDILYDATEQKGGLYETTDKGSIKIACFENRKQVELFENTIVRAIREYTDKVLKGETIEGRPKGKRIVLKDGIYACSLEGIDVPITVYECSNCGWVDSFEYEEDSNFCPYCGADLRSEE